jgi:hypothetical protein
VLRGIPPSLIAEVRECLVDADTRWTRLLLDLVALPQTDPASISAKVFGPELGCASAAATALAVSAAGLATAFPALASTARATGIDMRP